MIHRSTLKIALLGILLVVEADGANRSDRYADAYKKYVSAKTPVPTDGIRHFVYFARNRDAMRGHAFLKHPRFVGAQIMYPWSKLEPEQDQYDFSAIRSDYEYLKAAGKKLFVQLQDATFSPQFRGVPSYLSAKEYDGGMVRQRNDKGIAEGWTAKRWNPEVRKRFALLLRALGREFDGKIEGINLQETAVGMGNNSDPSYTPANYVAAIKANMAALKTAFPNSTTMQYANFMPGEWLPWEDKGYLKSIYRHGEKIGVGLGAPDLMVRRKGQLNHALAMMHEASYSVPLGIAVQDGNYTGVTGADFPIGQQPKTRERKIEDRPNLVPMLHAFAKDFLRVQYMFWVNQEPYFAKDVLPSFKME